MKTSYNRFDIESAKRTAREYCKKNGLDEKLLDSQSVYFINGKIIFAQPSMVKANGLRNDRDTQPIPTLVVEKKESNFCIQPTDYTVSVLGIAGLK